MSAEWPGRKNHTGIGGRNTPDYIAEQRFRIAGGCLRKKVGAARIGMLSFFIGTKQLLQSLAFNILFF